MMAQTNKSVPGTAVGAGIVERDSYSEKQMDEEGGEILSAMYLELLERANLPQIQQTWGKSLSKFGNEVSPTLQVALQLLT